MHHIEMVQLSNFSNAYIRQLSGGMKQCAAIGHALAMNPKLLLMDEPFPALDIQIHQDRTILFLTHNINDAMVLGCMLVVLSPKLAGIKRGCTVGLPRPRDHPIVDSNATAITEESEELYFDDETGEDSKIAATKVFH
jgi:ABC-type nitrate/sulfonate/bicarbonate transport system ATPase subunit